MRSPRDLRSESGSRVFSGYLPRIQGDDIFSCVRDAEGGGGDVLPGIGRMRGGDDAGPLDEAPDEVVVAVSKEAVPAKLRGSVARGSAGALVDRYQDAN